MAEPRRHLGVGAALSVLVQGGPLLAGATLSIVLARTIGPSANGRFALLGTLAGLLELVFSLSLSAGIVYEVSRRRWSVRQAFRTCYAAALVLGLAAFGVGLGIFALLHDSVFGGISTGLAVVALMSIPPVLAYLYADAILLARERYEGYAGLELSHSATFLVVGAGLAIPFGVTGAVIGLPAAAAVAASVGAFLLAREAARDTSCRYAGLVRTSDPLRAAELGRQSAAADQLPLRRPDPRGVCGDERCRCLFGRPDVDGNGLGAAGRASDGAVPARRKPRRGDARGRREHRGVGCGSREGDSPRRPVDSARWPPDQRAVARRGSAAVRPKVPRDDLARLHPSAGHADARSRQDP